MTTRPALIGGKWEDAQSARPHDDQPATEEGPGRGRRGRRAGRRPGGPGGRRAFATRRGPMAARERAKLLWKVGDSHREERR